MIDSHVVDISNLNPLVASHSRGKGPVIRTDSGDAVPPAPPSHPAKNPLLDLHAVRAALQEGRRRVLDQNTQVEPPSRHRPPLLPGGQPKVLENRHRGQVCRQPGIHTEVRHI